MPLEDFMGAGEKIVHQSKGLVEIGETRYGLYITDKKMLGYVQEGLVFKKDNALTITFGDISDMKYSEEGIIGKKGILRVDTVSKRGKEMTYVIRGAPGDVKGAWQALQQFIS